VYVDAMTITAPGHAAVLTMPSQVPVERCSWSAIKALCEQILF
jgi:hypothetical protein